MSVLPNRFYLRTRQHGARLILPRACHGLVRLHCALTLGIGRASAAQEPEVATHVVGPSRTSNIGVVVFSDLKAVFRQVYKP
jgi:hypothetical protein